MKVSLVVVCHYSSAVLPACVEGFRREASVAGIEPEVVIVEHSEDPGEVQAVSNCRSDKLLIRANGGYAAGLNAGIPHATGDIIFLGNPDIEFLGGSVRVLVDAVVGGADVAGPQLLWDTSGEVLLPVPDDPGPAAEIARTIRRRWLSKRAMGRILDTSWRLWTAEQPCEAPSLRGPLMALRRETASRLGPLDEGYFLYYEETEWLWRARRAGARLVVAPRARVVHRWGHSTSRSGQSAEIEERSRRRFFRRNYSAPVRMLLRFLAPIRSRGAGDFVVVDGPEFLPQTDADVWLVSIVSNMEPAAGCRGGSVLPPSALKLMTHGRWYAVAARRESNRWRLMGSWTWERK